MHTKAPACVLAVLGLALTAGCADPAGRDTDPTPDGGPVISTTDGGPSADSGVTGQVRVRAIGLGPSGGTSTSTTFRVTGEIGQPTSSGRASGPDHTVVGGAGRPAQP